MVVDVVVVWSSTWWWSVDVVVVVEVVVVVDDVVVVVEVVVVVDDVVVVVGVGGVTEQTELSGGVTTWRIVFVTGPSGCRRSVRRLRRVVEHDRVGRARAREAALRYRRRR